MLSQPRLRFLVADDKEEWRDIIVHILEVDYDLAGVVKRGDEIVESARQLHPDVITLDVSMPGESGLNALPQLRAALPGAIILVVSATATPLYMHEAAIRGADGYVEKSTARSDLVNRIASVRESRLPK